VQRKEDAAQVDIPAVMAAVAAPSR